MVTGVETAGLILGSLPLVIEGLKFYQSGIKSLKRTWEYDQSLKKLIRRVKEQKIGLEDNLEKLLLAANSASGIRISFGNDYWSQLSMGQSGQVVKDYLGESKHDLFEELMEEFESTLLEIANALHKVQRSRKKESTTGHLTISEIHKLASLHNTQLNPFSKRIFYLIEEETVIDLTKSLDGLNSTMDRILKDARELHQLKSIHASRIIPDERKASAMASILRQIRTYTDKLFEAFCIAWVSNCHPSHKVALFLDVPAFSSLGYPNSATSFNFRALLSEDPADVQVSVSWHEASVTVLEDNTLGTLNLNTNAPSSIQTLATPAITITPSGSTPSQSNFNQVRNMCTEIERARQACKSLELLLRCGHPLVCGDLSHSQKRGTTTKWDTVSFEQLLSSRERIFPNQKVRLALKLAVSLLQLKTSQWLCGTWSNQAVHFPKRAFAGNSPCIEKDQPLVLYTFSDSTPSISKEPKPRLIFLELGILLMEIWNEESFAAFAKRECQIEQMDPYRRDGVAREWFDVTSEQMTERYAKVVEACLSFAFEHIQGVHTWDDENLWKSVCSKVIEPLKEESSTFAGR